MPTQRQPKTEAYNAIGETPVRLKKELTKSCKIGDTKMVYKVKFCDLGVLRIFKNKGNIHLSKPPAKAKPNQSKTYNLSLKAIQVGAGKINT
jgi:hypothetical protein